MWTSWDYEEALKGPFSGGMTSPGTPLWEFCGFTNGTTFRTKYIMDESTMTLTPCTELSIMLAESIPMLIAFVMGFFMISEEFPRIDDGHFSHDTPYVIRCFQNFRARCYICLATVVALMTSIILSFTTANMHLRSAYVVEYSILFLVWMTSGAFWMFSCLFNSWSSSRLISITTFFGTKIFHMIAVNRVMLYGWGDGRAIIAIVMSVCHLMYAVTKIIDWRLRREANPHVRLYDMNIEDNEKVDEGCSLFSKIFFTWTNPLIKKGSHQLLNEVSDLFRLPPSLNVETIEKKFIECSPTLFSDGEHFKVHKALFNTFGFEFLLLGLLRLASDAFTFTSPILLHLLVEAFSLTEPTDDAFYLTVLTILCQFLGAMFSSNFTYYTTKVGLKIRTALVTSIYDRLLSIPTSEMSTDSGQVINYITTDIDRIVNFCNSFHAAWSLPLQAVVGIYLLYREIGLAVVAGVVCAFIIVPINNLITKQIGKMSEKFMAAKDRRMKITSEIVSGFRVVKMSGTEEFFEKKIVVLRQEELRYLKIRKYLDALCVYFWASAPLLITISILTTHTVFLHEKLTAAKVFPVLALVNILIMPLNAMPWVFNGLIEAQVSLKRLQKFYKLKQIDFRDVYSKNDDQNTLLSVVNGKFEWKDSFHSVKGLKLIGKKGQIIGITGEVGTGKSTLLMGLLGETLYTKDTISTTQDCIDNGIGYMGQERWLIRGTVRENILAGKEYNEMLYQDVLKGSCLRDDIRLMPGGDSYMISDNGASLSGGQRTRLALARALYQDNSVYILDEPFASLDSKVAHTIHHMAIEPMKGRNKLVIIATHDKDMLARFDYVVVIDKHGTIEAQGHPRDLGLDALEKPFEGVVNGDEVVVNEVHTYERVAPRDEERQTGAVKVNVYTFYAGAVGGFLSFAIIFALVAMQVTKNGADLWLSKWTESQGNFTQVGLPGLLYGDRPYEYNDESDQDKAIHFLKIYSYIALANTIFTLARSFFFAYGGLRAAKKLHTYLLGRILRSTVDWLDRTPSGRIINRLCADVYTVDDSLPFTMNIFFATFVNLTGSIVVTLLGLPYIVVVYAALAVIYYFIQKHYRRTTVELKRLSSLSLSPFFCHVKDTVNGLVVIRAQRFSNKFHKKLRSLLTSNMRTQFSSLAASQWLNIRLSLLAIAVIATISFGAIIQHRINAVNSGLVGLSITYALALTSMLNGLLSSFIETEKEMVAVERIEEYVDDLPEENLSGRVVELSKVKGRIELHQVCLKYDAGLPLALKDVSLVIDPKMKVAIQGRTGSGKSSIFACLLRTARMNSGHITIDGVDIASLALPNLRSMFGVIPQHPFIFSGSLYDNLTLYCKNPDLNMVIHVCKVGGLGGLVTRIGDVYGKIEEGGENLSFGEKQIISFSRVLLSKPRIILVDEGTSHLDNALHAKLFDLLRTLCSGATLLSIVHKTTDLDKYDMVIEMAEGQIISQKAPNLMEEEATSSRNESEKKSDTE